MKQRNRKLTRGLIFLLTLALLLAPLTAFAQGGDEHGGRHPQPKPWRLTGTITAMPNDGVIGEWAIDDQPFMVEERTRIDEGMGVLSVGAHATAQGVVRGDQQIATLVKALPLCEECPCGPEARWRLVGEIDAMPSTEDMTGVWVIAGQEVQATVETTFRPGDSEFAVGVLVVSAGTFDVDGNRIAKVIGILPQRPGHTHRPGAGWQLLGEIESMPGEGLVGNWVVAGQSFSTTESTSFGKHPEAFEVGAILQAVGYFDDGGNAVAHRLNAVRVGDGDCPTD
ncbi:MAG: hypothetical protein J5I90_00205 [Caldilineales bacterium]|nr:hypothetical protein [Caldilineales bacterium]